jgi:hypothetical protein
MKLLFSGDSGCAPIMLKRLMMVAKEISFIDRPYVSFAGWVSSGSASPLRQFEYAMSKTAVRVSVHSAPSALVDELYYDYLASDLANPDFRRIECSSQTTHWKRRNCITRCFNGGHFNSLIGLVVETQSA